MMNDVMKSGLALIGNAQIYYEIAGEGAPFVMIHAGVADSRQWNNEFEYYAQKYRVLRYDQRGYGKSEPVEGEYSHLGDLIALLEYLGIGEPLILMGCSMGGGLSIDYALENPGQVKALILLGSGPAGLDLNLPDPPLMYAAEEAYKAGDLNRAAELETHGWFDGVGRTPQQVDPQARNLAYEMDRLALGYASRGLGKRMPNTSTPAVQRLDGLKIPLLAIVGDEDIEYVKAAADYMETHIPQTRKVVMQDAAHLANMEYPAQFRAIVDAFLADAGL